MKSVDREKSWNRSDLIALGSVLVSIVGVVVGVIVAIAPSEVRCVLHLPSEICPSSSHAILQEVWHRSHKFFLPFKDTEGIADHIQEVWHRSHKFFLSKDTEGIVDRIQDVWHGFVKQ